MTLWAMLVVLLMGSTTPHTFTACTSDSRLVALVLNIDDDSQAQHPAIAHIAHAFTHAAAVLTVAQLFDDRRGVLVFIAGLDADDMHAFRWLDDTAPTVIGRCANA